MKNKSFFNNFSIRFRLKGLLNFGVVHKWLRERKRIVMNIKPRIVVAIMKKALSITKWAFQIFKALSRYLHRRRKNYGIQEREWNALATLDAEVFQEIKTLHEYLIWFYWGRSYYMFVWHSLDDLEKGVEMHRSLSRYLLSQKQSVQMFHWEKLSDLPEGEKYRLFRIPCGHTYGHRPMLLINECTLGSITYPGQMKVRLLVMKTEEWDQVSRPKEGDTIMRQGDKYVKTDRPSK